jgi:glyoxylase-like metal-dependent hydrolase (beta-lactamase superfamily II)
MPAFICMTCGTQYPPADTPPESCPICVDERQFVPEAGQRWTTLEAMRYLHLNAWRRYEPDLYGVGTTPQFAIGQRALLARAKQGNVLWDCISLIDDATVGIVKALGGIAAIAISHPHFYSSMVEWAHAFDVPIFLHEADRQHVMRPDAAVRFWSGATHTLLEGVTLINLPGHFDGATVLHWEAGAGGRGSLLASDMLFVAADRKHVSLMRSYPNLIPQSARTVRAAAGTLQPYAFDRVYGIFWDRFIDSGGKAAVERSIERYLRWIAD